MNVLLILIAASLGMALLFLGGFIWATRSGQFEDTSTPALRVLTDDPRVPPTTTPEDADSSDREYGRPVSQRTSHRSPNSDHQT